MIRALRTMAKHVTPSRTSRARNEESVFGRQGSTFTPLHQLPLEGTRQARAAEGGRLGLNPVQNVNAADRHQPCTRRSTMARSMDARHSSRKLGAAGVRRRGTDHTAAASTRASAWARRDHRRAHGAQLRAERTACRSSPHPVLAECKSARHAAEDAEVFHPRLSLLGAGRRRYSQSGIRCRTSSGARRRRETARTSGVVPRSCRPRESANP